MRSAYVLLREARDTFGRADLGSDAAAVASWVLAEIVAGRVKVRHAGDAAELLRCLVDVARLEAGQHTAANLTTTVTVAEVVELQRQARAALGIVVAEVHDSTAS